MRFAWTAPIVLVMGCASGGPVPTGPDTYMIAGKAYGMGSGAVDAKANAYREANAFCESKGKAFRPLEGGTDRNGGFMRFPQAEVHFSCVDRPDAKK